MRKKQAYTYIVKWFMTQVTLEYSGKRMIFSINGAALVGYPHGKNVSNTIYAKINSRWTVDLNGEKETRKHLEKKNIGEHLSDFEAGKTVKARVKSPNMEENSVQESIIKVRTIYSKT